ncbi:hypothetical protein [Paraglaciecola chathamensis]|uniref:Carboxypeptidase regulatory-like domain-containing protein n=1 Tax=Paraglaciecola chathamensis S18K6 TaxID=1127672 RepID=A0AAV3V733_9ALTE|nr:hypothetical protein [Paraglaciecola chathamensis]GAC12447.1 hypothetical protein GCHA_4530 [Paraglaciecola chathamensis S18K6]
MKYSKIAIAVSATVLLNGCLEVEDKNNSEVVNALQQQNEILSEQDQKKSVTVRGLIVNARDSEPVSSAKITVKTGVETIAEGIVGADGKFSISDLPSNSDLDLIVTSDSDEFMSRAFFFNTEFSEGSNNQQDIGILGVSEAVDVSFTVLNGADNTPVTDLVFKADSSSPSYSGVSSSTFEYLHLSTFDEVNGIYNMTLPRYIDVAATASLDVNKDGEPDYVLESLPFSSGNNITFFSANEGDANEIYLLTADDAAPEEVEYRVALVDEFGDPLLGATVLVNDQYNDDVSATYDAEAGEYVISAAFVQSLSIQIPAFSVGEINYQSASINIGEQNDGRLSVYYSGAADYASYYVSSDTESLSFAIQPQEIVNNVSELEAVLVSEPSKMDSSWNVFYSQSVAVEVSDVTLTNLDAFTVTKGNASTDDLVLAGTTSIVGGIDMAVSVALSKNDTRLTVSPDSLLVAGDSYQYTVGTIEVVATGQTIDLASDSKQFTVPANEEAVFDIAQVRLDNNNYTTNGNAITAQNTAGEASTPFDYDRNVYLVLPSTVNSLQSFTMRRVSIVEDGSSALSIETYNLVENGNVQLNSSALVALAQNETLYTDNINFSIYDGMNLPDVAKAYMRQMYIYLSDSTSSNENSATFEYAYETKSGDVVTGNIKLNVE